MTRSIAKLLLDAAELRAGSVITEAEIAALKRRWNPFNADRNGIDAYAECCALMEGGPFQLTAEHIEKGKAFWRAKLFLNNGELRKTQFVREIEAGNSWAGHIIKHLDTFQLFDWEWTINSYGISWPFPVIRAQTAAGLHFDYIMRPWQSGGVEVM